MSLVAIDWSAVTKTTLLVLSPGASVLVLLAVEYLKVLIVSWVVLLRNRGVVAEPVVGTPSPKRRGRSSSRGRRSTSRGRRGRSASVGRPSETDSVATAPASPSPRRRSAARVKRFVTSSIDLLVQVTSFLVLAHMLHLMGEEIVEMITETSTTATSSIFQIISSKMVVISAIGAIKGFAVVAALLLEDGSDSAAASSSPRRTSHHSAPAPSPMRLLLRNVQQYGLVIAMTLHTLSEGVAAALVDSRAAVPTQTAAASSANLFTPYFLALIAHNVCEGLVVAASVKSKASTSASASGSWKKKKLPAWFISAAIQSITAHIAQPLAYGATTLFIGSSIAAKLQATIGGNSIIMTMMPMEAVPILISSFALGSLLGAVVFEVAPSVISAMSVTRRNL